eukprot:3044527-Rhodomonas_salina.1
MSRADRTCGYDRRGGGSAQSSTAGGSTGWNALLLREDESRCACAVVDVILTPLMVGIGGPFVAADDADGDGVVVVVVVGGGGGGGGDDDDDDADDDDDGDEDGDDDGNDDDASHIPKYRVTPGPVCLLQAEGAKGELEQAQVGWNGAVLCFVEWSGVVRAGWDEAVLCGV